MNTMNQRFNFLTLPKLNTNLLRVISFIVLSELIFTPVIAFADDCDDKLQAAAAAAKEFLAAVDNYEIALEAFKEALSTDPTDYEAISLATTVLKRARETLQEKAAAFAEADQAYEDCLSNQGDTASGSCDSGSCG